MFTEQLNYKAIILMALLVWVASSGCAWKGRIHIINSGSSDILFVKYGLGARNFDDCCLFEKTDSIHYRSKEDCFQVAEFRETKDSGVYSTVIPPNHVLYKGRGPLHSRRVTWFIKDPETMEVVNDLNDLWHWKVYPEKFISFRRVFVYEVVDQEVGKE